MLKVGFIGHLLTHRQPVATIEKYLQKCKDLGFNVIELSKGFLSLPGEDWIRLVEMVQKHKMEPKPELGIAQAGIPKAFKRPVILLV